MSTGAFITTQVVAGATITSILETGAKGDPGVQGIQGPAGIAGINGTNGQTWKVDVSPVEAPNAIRTTFTTPDTYIAGNISVFLNGLLQTHVNDFTEVSTTSVQFVSPPFATDTIRFIYRTT